MIHGNVLVKIHGEIKKNDKNELHLQNAQCFKIALYEMLALKFGSVDLQIHVQSVAITSEVMSSNPAHGEVFSIQQFVIKFGSDLRQVGGSRDTLHP
jgi:hypothetical protein